MLVITPRQMTMLEKARTDSFRDQLLQQLAPRERRAEAVSYALASADRFGLRRECDVARLAELLCASGDSPESGLPREALSILCTYGLAPEEKLSRFARWIGQP
jgi:hypothetical protein